MHRIAVLALIALALLLFGAALASPSEAQGSWTCDWDFSLGLHGWTVVQGDYSSGAVNHADSAVGADYVRGVKLELGLSASSTLTSMSISYSYTAGSVMSPHNQLNVYSNPPWNHWIGYTGLGSSPYSWSGSKSIAGGLYIEMQASRQSSATYSGAASISSITLSGTGTAPCSSPTPTPTGGPTNTPAPTNTPTLTPSPTATSTPVPTNLTLGSPIEITYETGKCVDLDTGDTFTAGTYNAGTTYGGCVWRNRAGPTSFTLPPGRYLMGWLSRVKSSEITTGSGDVDLRHTMGDGQGPATYGTGTLRDYVCTTRNNAIPNNGVPGYTWPGSYMCASYPAYTTIRDTVIGLPGTSVALGGSAQNNMVVDAGALIVFEIIPIYYVFEPAPTVTLTCPTGDLTAGLTYELEAETTNEVDTWAWDFGDGNTSSEADGLVEFSWPMAGTYTVEVTVEGPGGEDSDSCELTILRPGDPGGGGGALYRPLLTLDADTGFTYTNTPLGLISPAAAWGGPTILTGTLAYSGADDETVIGLSQTAGAKVYNVADGTILDVQPLAAGACDALTYSSIGNGVLCQSTLYGEDLGGDWAPYATIEVNTAGLYKVTVSYITGVVIEYYVANAPLYVRAGQVLLAGCIIGETTPYHLASNTVGVPDQSGKQMFWMQALQLSDQQQVPILAQLFIEPSAATACNAGGEYSDCLFDPLFQNQTYRWTVQGNVSWADGVTLSPGASISLGNLTLDASTAYGFTVWAERPRTYGPADARITLSIGTSETSFFLSEGIRTAYTIASATHTADQGSLYSIRITNSGSAPFTVLQNCVSTGEPNTAPATCYFQNHTFDGQLSGWTTTGTVIPDPSGPVSGQIAIMSDLAVIGQNVRLYADGGGGDHEYTVILEGVLHGTGTSFFQVRYRFGGGGWVTPDVTGWGINEQNLNASRRTMTIEFDVPSGTYAGLLEFQFDFTAAGDDVIGDTLWLSLYSLCLSDSGSWSHHPGGGGSNWTPGTGCDTSAPPLELQDDFGAWISYHFNGMENIYYCDVIPQLERLNNITYSIYEYAQWSGLYSQAAQAQAMTWADRTLFPWLGGHLSNIARAAGGALGVDVGGGCHDLFCLLDTLIRGAIAPIFDIAGRILDFLIQLLGTVINLFKPLLELFIETVVQLIRALLSVVDVVIGLISAFAAGVRNAQPAPVPGLPNCALDPSSNSLCAVMYGLEQTIFSGEGAAIIPLFIGILSIVQLQWLIGKVAELISEVTGRI